jgi:hypothetical protein
MAFERSGPNMSLLVRLQVPASREGPFATEWVRPVA